MNRRWGVVAVAATVGLVGVIAGGVAVSATLVTAQNGTGVSAVRTLVSTSQTQSSSSSFTTVPGGSMVVQGPTSGTAFFVMRLQGRADCAAPKATQQNNVACVFVITVDGKPAAPGTDFAITASNTQGYVPDADFNYQAVSTRVGAGSHTIALQYAALPTSGNPGYVQLDDWSLVVERVK